MDDSKEAQTLELVLISHLLRLTEDDRKEVMQNIRREAPNLPEEIPLYVFGRFHSRDNKGVKLDKVWWNIEHFEGHSIPALMGIEPLRTKSDNDSFWIYLSGADSKVLCERFNQAQKRFILEPRGYIEVLSRYISYIEARGGTE